MDKKTIKKYEIIRKSINVMHIKGYNGVGVKELSVAAGIPKGSFYNYFESKEDYGKEALDYYYSVINQEKFNILLDKEINPIDRIKLFYRNMIDKINQEKKFKLGCFIGNLTQEVSCSSDVIQEITKKIHQEIAIKIENCLKEGNIKNSKELGEFLVNSWQGVLLRTKSCNNSEPTENFYKILVEVLLK
ncbi:MAG: TetR/AcrR family transcriptional regulator [Fusobacteriaceae bacterium]